MNEVKVVLRHGHDPSFPVKFDKIRCINYVLLEFSDDDPTESACRVRNAWNEQGRGGISAHWWIIGVRTSRRSIQRWCIRAGNLALLRTVVDRMAEFAVY